MRAILVIKGKFFLRKNLFSLRYGWAHASFEKYGSTLPKFFVPNIGYVLNISHILTAKITALTTPNFHLVMNT